MRNESRPAASPPSDTSGGRRRLFTRSGLIFVALGALVLQWPALFAGGVLLFPDSGGYLTQGAKAVAFVLEQISPGSVSVPGETVGGPGPAAGASETRLADEVSSLRSAPYALFAWATAAATPAGPLVTMWLQTALVLILVLAVAGEPEWRRPGWVVAAAMLALATPLPFFATFLMPDLLGAAVILYAVLLVRGHETLAPLDRVLLALIAAFAVMAHYGHIPLAAGSFAAAVVVLAMRRNVGLWLLGLVGSALGLAVVANFAIGLLAFESASLTPGRMPLLLARSLEDGPARWHLEENCSRFDYAVCEYWRDDIPGSVSEAMWGPRGLHEASAALQDSVRAEEPLILWRAFQEYPVAQTRSLLSNAARQLWRLGLDDIRFGNLTRDGASYTVRFQPYPDLRAAMEGLEWLYRATYAAGGAALLILAAGRSRPGDRDAILVLAAGLAVNALVFGGLSAPADRYQARIAWLVPLLALVLIRDRRSVCS